MKSSTGKRILMLLENNTYPQDPRVRREATTLTQNGYRVMVICPWRKGQPSRETINGVAVYRFPPPAELGGTLGYIWEYAYSMTWMFALSLLVLVTRGFDVLHAHNPPDTFIFMAALYKLMDKKFVFDHHDLSPELYVAQRDGKGNAAIYRVLVWFEQITCRLSDHVIATNQSYKTVVMERGGVPEERITIVRNGPELEKLPVLQPDPELRKKARTIIGYVGNMGHQDGVDYLLRALRHLIIDLGQSDFYCVLVGTGSAWNGLRQLAQELGLDRHVWLTGWVSDSDLIGYLSTADICVDPDPSNPFNDRCTMIKMTEYMALGKPIVAFDLPEHRVTAQDAAVYARGNDELDFARHIALLIDNPERRQRMGVIGKERVVQTLAWPHQATRLLAAYEMITGNGAAAEKPHRVTEKLAKNATEKVVGR